MSEANCCKQWTTDQRAQVWTMPCHSVWDSLLFACFPRLGLLQQQEQQVV